MKSKKRNELMILSVVLAIVVMVFLLLFPLYDLSIVSSFNSLQSTSFASFMSLISLIGSGIAVFFVVTVIFLLTNESRKKIIPLWLAFILTTLVVLGLKVLLLRERPFEILGIVAKEFEWWNASFPSWHAAMSFAAIPFISMKFPKLKIWWILFAIIIVLSRVYFAYHFVSDIIAGALIGYFAGLLFLRAWPRGKKK